jgi:DNA-binding IclR family transcriptional regulator
MDSVPNSVKNGPLTIAELSRKVGMKPDKVRRMINKSLKQMKAVIGEEWKDFEQEFQQ